MTSGIKDICAMQNQEMFSDTENPETVEQRKRVMKLHRKMGSLLTQIGCQNANSPAKQQPLLR
jgi:hypothetical protein